MAVIVANPDGSSSAKAGDTVITGGGIYRKNADGSSTKLEGLRDFIGSDKTKDYSALKTIAESYASRERARAGGSASDTEVSRGKETTPATDDTYYATGIDQNGIVSSVTGFTPVDYSSSSSAGSSSGLNKVLGMVILGLVGLAILDRFVGGKGEK